VTLIASGLGVLAFVSETKPRLKQPNRVNWRGIQLGLQRAAVVGFVVGLAVLPTFAVRFHIGEPITRANNFFSAGDYVYAQRWLTNEQLDESGAGFVRAGGGNWPCNADPERCLELNALALPAMSGEAVDLSRLKAATFETLLTRPLQVLTVKSPVIFQSHTSLPGQSVGTSSPFGTAFWLVTWAVFAQIVYEAKRQKSLGRILVVLMPLTIAQVAALYFAHVETRYLLPIAASIWALHTVMPRHAMSEQTIL
jgi:hypothetical protein